MFVTNYQEEINAFEEEIKEIYDPHEQTSLNEIDRYNRSSGLHDFKERNFNIRFNQVWKVYQRKRTQALKRLNRMEMNMLLKRLAENNEDSMRFCSAVKAYNKIADGKWLHMDCAFDKLWTLIVDMKFDNDMVMDEWLVLNVLIKFPDWSNNWSCKGECVLEKSLETLNNSVNASVERAKIMMKEAGNSGTVVEQKRDIKSDELVNDKKWLNLNSGRKSKHEELGPDLEDEERRVGVIEGYERRSIWLFR
jgi:hypothetical protein